MHEDLNTASRRRKTHKRYKLQVKSASSATNDSKSGSAPEAADALRLHGVIFEGNYRNKGLKVMPAMTRNHNKLYADKNPIYRIDPTE